MISKNFQTVGLWFLVLTLMLPTFFIFFWMVSLSLKGQLDNTSYPPVFFPTDLQFSNYVEVFEKNPFSRYFVNSLIVGFGSTGLALLLGAPAAYGIAKWKKYGLGAAVLIARMVPGLSFLIPWFILFQKLGLINTYTSLILAEMVVALPLVIWILISFFENINQEIEDASLVDGCNQFSSFLRISLPLTLPGLAVAGILAFIASWNNFIFPVILAGPYTRTLPVAVYNMMSFEQVYWGTLAAGALVVTFPVLILTLFIQKFIVSGLATGGIKG